jgi:hypothetical protein
MIVAPFNVRRGPKRYDFVDRAAIDSQAERDAVQAEIVAQLDASQQDAMCAALGIPGVAVVPNFGFAVYESGVRVGVYLMASNAYQSGPWADLMDWEETSPGAPIVLHGRHMPGFGGLSTADEQALSAEVTWHVLSKRLATVGGREIAFQRVSWAIFLDRTDSASERDKGVHGAIVNDARLRAITAADPNDAALTRVDVELA